MDSVNGVISPPAAPENPLAALDSPLIAPEGPAAPLSCVVLSTSWILGRVGIIVSDYTTFYIIYYIYLVPLLFSVSIYLLASQIVRRLYSRIFVIVMAAFSPGVILNLSDMGLEQTAYGFLFSAAFLRYYSEPNGKHFVRLISASCLVMLAFNHISIF